jgi:hypothetical protein
VRWHRSGFRLYWRWKSVVTRRLRTMGISDRPITPRSPWQNGHVERLIGSIRRECLDHVTVLGERHLRNLLANSRLRGHAFPGGWACRNLFQNCAERQLVPGMLGFAVRSGHRTAKRTILNKSSGDPNLRLRRVLCAASSRQSGCNLSLSSVRCVRAPL